MPTPGSAAAFYNNSQNDNDRDNPLNYPAGQPWEAPGMGLVHNKRTVIAFVDAHSESVPKLSPVTFAATNDAYWWLGQ
jgi:hypothetical protein